MDTMNSNDQSGVNILPQDGHCVSSFQKFNQRSKDQFFDS